MSRIVRIAVVRLLVVFGAVISAPARAEEAHETAIWATQKSHFDYLGVTTLYPCYKLRDKIRQVVLTLGARPDLNVTPTGCNGDRPVQDPGVDIKMATPKPGAGADSADASWKAIDLGAQGGLDGADCELAEQIVQKILPLFHTRNVQMKTRCVPYQRPTGSLSLTLEVLVIAKGA